MNCGVSQLGKINMQSKVFIFCIYLVRSKVDIDISVILLSRIKNKKKNGLRIFMHKFVKLILSLS